MLTKLAQDIVTATSEKLSAINYGSKGGLLNTAKAVQTSTPRSIWTSAANTELADILRDVKYHMTNNDINILSELGYPLTTMVNEDLKAIARSPLGYSLNRSRLQSISNTLNPSSSIRLDGLRAPSENYLFRNG